jgi:hypothetical protein
MLPFILLKFIKIIQFYITTVCTNYENKFSVHLAPWLAKHVIKEVKYLAALTLGTCVASTGRGFLYSLFNSNRDMEAAFTIETSLIT